MIENEFKIDPTGHKEFDRINTECMEASKELDDMINYLGCPLKKKLLIKQLISRHVELNRQLIHEFENIQRQIINEGLKGAKDADK